MPPVASEPTATAPRRIARLADVQDRGPVPSPHTNEASYAVDASGRLWVRKRESITGWEELLAEALAWLLADPLGVPAPDAAVVLAPGEESWLSAFVPDVVAHWSAGAGPIENRDGLAATLVLDALLANPDRHARNILLAPAAGGRVRAWAIDWGDALAGHPADFAAAGERLPSVRNAAPGLPLADLDEHADAAARRAAALDPGSVASTVAEAFAVARTTPPAGYAESLLHRLSVAPRLTREYLRLLQERAR